MVFGTETKNKKKIRKITDVKKSGFLAKKKKPDRLDEKKYGFSVGKDVNFKKEKKKSVKNSGK